MLSHRFALGRLLAIACLLAPALGLAEVNEARARYHYQMFCQGCHTPDGSGAGAVPALRNAMGVFLNSQQGREFLVRVPGSATSKLNDADLAEVLNWCLNNFAGESLPADGFTPYTPEEVALLRARPLQEINDYRAATLAAIAAASQQE